jgi:hypothetical protein
MDTTATSAPRTSAVSAKLAVRAFAGAAIGTSAALILLLLATSTGQVLQVQVGTRAPQEVAAGAIVSVILASGVGAWGTAALAIRLAPRPRAAFLAIAALALALSLVPPVTAASGAATWWLEAMHLVVFTALVAALAPAIPPRRVTWSVPVEAQGLLPGGS